MGLEEAIYMLQRSDNLVKGGFVISRIRALVSTTFFLTVL